MQVNSDPLITGITIVVVVVLFGVSAFLSAADKALEAVSRNYIRTLAEEGNPRAQRLQRIFQRPANFFEASQVLRTFGGGCLCALLFLLILTQWAPAGETLSSLVVVGTLVVVSLIFAVLHVVLVSIVPKQIASRHPEEVALALGGLACLCSRICRPLVVINRCLGDLFLKLFGQNGYQEEEDFSEDEVKTMLEVGQESGVIKEEGRRMIDSIFAFDDKLAYEIMTPRTDVFSIDINDATEEYLENLMKMQFSRIPVYEEDSDNIIGLLHIKDFLIKARETGFDQVDLRQILRPPLFAPETKNIDSLFYELQTKRQHMAILIDEYGGFSGVVTLEDIIEEVMGDIDDEFDVAEPTIREINDHTYMVAGTMYLDDINEELGTDLTSDSSETLGGFLIDILGEIPPDGSRREVQVEGYRFDIQEVQDRRIERVQLVLEKQDPPTSGEETEGRHSLMGEWREPRENKWDLMKEFKEAKTRSGQ